MRGRRRIGRPLAAVRTAVTGSWPATVSRLGPNRVEVDLGALSAATEYGRGRSSSPNQVSTALITGGTSGFGLAMARALAGVGVTVVLTGCSVRRAEETAGGIPGAIGLGLDVTDELSIVRVADWVVDRLGRVDLLVNNAGLGMRTVNPRFLSEPLGFWQVPVEGFRAVIETNLVGYFLVARAVTARILAAGGGLIVSISVSESTMRRAGNVPYGPSRAGSESLSRIMAADLLGSGITVNLLLPGGPTATGMVPNEADLGGGTPPARCEHHGSADRLAGEPRCRRRP